MPPTNNELRVVKFSPVQGVMKGNNCCLTIKVKYIKKEKMQNCISLFFYSFILVYLIGCGEKE